MPGARSGALVKLGAPGGSLGCSVTGGSDQASTFLDFRYFPIMERSAGEWQFPIATPLRLIYHSPVIPRMLHRFPTTCGSLSFIKCLYTFLLIHILGLCCP